MFPNPMFSIMPLLQQGMQQNQQEAVHAPTRVRFALEFLTYLTQKTMSRIAVSEHQIHEAEGQKLTNSEINTQATACHVINDYLLGKLELDHWEEVELVKQRGLSGGTMLNCMACYPNTREDCKICKGMGRVIVVPVVDGGE